MLRRFIFGLGLFAATVLSLAQSGDKAGEIQREVVPLEKIPPAPVLRPEEQLKTFRLPPGFRAELVAAEPLITTPVAIQFDAMGRLWAVEMNGYMPNPEGQGEQEPNGNIVILEDTDGDGRMDRRVVFLDRLVMPRSLMLYRDGALVAEPPRIWFARDTDGDGKADEKTLVADDFATQNDPKLGAKSNPEHASNSLTWALDNWIYAANHTTRFRNTDGTWKREPTIFRGQWGLTQDDYGRLYFNSNSDPLRGDAVPSKYLARNPNLKNPLGANQQLLKDMRVYSARVNPGVNRGYQPNQLTPEGRLATFTGACGPVIYRGNQFPTEYIGNAFLCEPTGNLIRRCVVKEDDGLLSAANAYDKDEFLTSTDERFRPVNLVNGPDGCLYVVDIARGLIQHRIYLTSYLRKQIESRGLQSPVQQGRIYRIVHSGKPRHAEALGKHPTSSELVQRLNHASGFWRDRAQQMLVERRDSEALPALRAQVDAAKNASTLGRLHTLWTLEGLAALDLETVSKALSDPSPKVRSVGIRLSEQLLTTEDRDDMIHQVLQRAGVGPLEEQLQLLFTLGEMAMPAADAITKILLMNSPASPLRFDAAISGLTGRELEFLMNLVNDPLCATTKQDHAPLLSGLARAVVYERRSARVAQLIDFASFRKPGDWQQVAILDGIAGTVPQAQQGKPAVGIKPIRLEREPKGLLGLRSSGLTNVLARLDRMNPLLVWSGKPGWVEPPPPPALSTLHRQSFERGSELYNTVCAACHQPHGMGAEGLAPPLVDSEWVLGSTQRLVRIVLHGVRDGLMVKGQRWDLSMPALGPSLDDQQVADVLTFLRREWDHGADPVDGSVVTQIRNATRGREDAWTSAELEKLTEP
jgi:mono/diheme cytochrome c family protein/glucose/arabinose dehydrogenase